MSHEMQVKNAHDSAIIISSQQEASNAFSIANLIFHPYAMERINLFAEEMSKSRALLPQCFHNDKEACRALLMKAGALNMDPFAIGAHAFTAPNGTIGFEAKVYQAIAESASGIKFSVEYKGDWSKVIGNTVERQGNKGKYRAPNWTAQDEKGLIAVITGVWPNGRTETLDVYMSECHPRLSTNWANDPRLQTYYAGLKKFLRRYAPSLIMGLFDRDDTSPEYVQTPEKELNPIQAATITKGKDLDLDDVFNVNQKPEPAPAQEPDLDIDDVFNANAVHEESFKLSKYEELSNLIGTSGTLEDLFEAGNYVNEAYKAGQITNEEQHNLRTDFQKKKNSF